MSLFLIFVILSSGFVLRTSGGWLFPLQLSVIPISGTFGELRPDHFHAGLDIKTQGEGKQVLAVESGYVFRVKVSPYGLGRAVYLRHPDGSTTVYGHLSGLAPRLEERVYARQFATKKFEQEIYFSPEQIPVAKGECIAFSGNSGNSFGPHLHFEVRDAENRVQDPLRFFPGLVKDSRKPILKKIAFEPLGLNSRVNGRFEKLEVDLIEREGVYQVPGIIPVSGVLGVEYEGYDMADEAMNKLGINFSSLSLDGKPIFEFALERFSFEERKFINVHIDFARYLESGHRFERAYAEDGNQLQAYPLGQDGRIVLQDDEVHELKMEFRDQRGNRSFAFAKIRRDTLAPSMLTKESSASPWLQISSRREVLLVELHHARKTHERGIDFEFPDGSKRRILPAYAKGENLVFLFDLSAGEIPGFISDPVSGLRQNVPVEGIIFPFKNNTFTLPGMAAFFPYGSAFDTVPFFARELMKVNGAWSAVFRVGDEKIPLLHPFILGLEPKPGAPSSGLVIARRSSPGKWQYAGGSYAEDGKVLASVGEFGEYCLMLDAGKPVVEPLDFKERETIPGSRDNIRVVCRDEFSGIDPGRIFVMLDGSWVLTEYDAKSASLSWKWKIRPAKGEHSLEISVYDRAGNVSEKQFSLRF